MFGKNVIKMSVDFHLAINSKHTMTLSSDSTGVIVLVKSYVVVQ